MDIKQYIRSVSSQTYPFPAKKALYFQNAAKIRKIKRIRFYICKKITELRHESGSEIPGIFPNKKQYGAKVLFSIFQARVPPGNDNAGQQA